MSSRSRLSLAAGLLLVLMALCVGENGSASTVEQADKAVYEDYGQNSIGKQSSTAVSVYKEPSGWLVNVLKEFFDDIDWQAIGNARDQIEKFIRKVDRLVGSFRQIVSRFANGAGQESAGSAGPRWRESRNMAGRWWWGAQSASAGSDATSVKEMLERVACFLGYVRLMNFSNEALAELDASKVVTNLFGAGVRRNSSSPWNWFG